MKLITRTALSGVAISRIGHPRTNSFGAFVTNRAVATGDIDGNVLTLEDR